MKQKLNYRFHNPNSEEDTAEFLCKMLVEINQDKVEKAIQEAAKLSKAVGDYISDVKEGQGEPKKRRAR